MRKIIISAIALLSPIIGFADGQTPPVYNPTPYPYGGVYLPPEDVDPGQTQANDIYKANEHPE